MNACIKETITYYKCYIIIEFIFLKVLMLIRQMRLRSALFVTVHVS